MSAQQITADIFRHSRCIALRLVRVLLLSAASLGFAGHAAAQEDFGQCDSRLWFYAEDTNGQPVLYSGDSNTPPQSIHRAGTGVAPGSLSAVAYNAGDQFIYAISPAGDGARGEVLRIDRRGVAQSVSEIHFTGGGGERHHVTVARGAFDHRGFYYVVPVAEKGVAEIHRVDPQSGTVQVLTLSEPVAITGLSWFDGYLYAVDRTAGLLRIDVQSYLSGSAAQVPVERWRATDNPPAVRGMAAAANGVFAYDDSGRVYRYDLNSGAPEAFGYWDAVRGEVLRCAEAPLALPDFAAARYRMGLPHLTGSGVGDELRGVTVQVEIYTRIELRSRSFVPGEPVSFRLVVGTESDILLDGVRVQFQLPAALASARWICRADGDSRCGEPRGFGPIDTLVSLDGGEIFFDVVADTATTARGPQTVRLSAAPPANILEARLDNNSDSVTLRPVVREDFGSCDSRMYLHQGAGTTDLILMDTGTSPFSYTTLGNTPNVQYNAAAYNPADNFIYAISSDLSLIRISADGSSEVVAINILPAAEWVAGTFASDGFMYVTTGGAQQNIFRIDVTLQDPFPTQALLFDTSQVTSPGDLAFYNGLMYTVDTATRQLRTFNVVGEPQGAVLPVTVVGDTNTFSPITAMWGASNGVFGADDFGNVYQFDINSGRASNIGNAPTSSVSDGSHCFTAPFELSTDLAITKDDFQTLYTPGQSVTYFITVTNNGPAAVEKAVVSDPLPAGITEASWTCSGNNGGTCGAANGNGALNDTPDIPVFGSVTYNFTLNVPRDFPGDLVNTATVTPPAGVTDSNPDNNTATDTNQRQPLLTIEKISFGGVGTFFFSVQNAGGSPNITTVEEGVAVQAPAQSIVNAGQQVVVREPTLAPGFTLTDITCTGLSEGGNYTVDLNERQVSIDGSGTLPGADIVCTFTNNAEPQASISLQKSLPDGRFAEGDQFQLSINGAGGTSATTTGSGTAVSPTITASQPVVGSSYTLSEAGSGSTNLANYTTTYSCTNGLAGGQTPSGSGTNFSFTLNQGDQLACTFVNTLRELQADLAVTKTDNSDLYVPGSDLTYTIVVNNNGPDDVTGATVSDALPAGVSSASWTCSANGGASCGALSGTGAINETVDLPAGGSITYLFTITVPEDYTGDLINTARADVPDGVIDPDPGNNSATDTNRRAPEVTIEKVSEGDVGTFSFSGGNGVPEQSITTTSPGQVQRGNSFYLSSANTATPITESGIPATFELTDITCRGLQAGSAVVDINTATVTLDAAATAAGSEITCRFTNERLSTDLAVTKSAQPTTVVAGDNVTYTITVDNLGPRDTTNAILTDTPDANLDCITPATISCSATGGAQCPVAPIDPAQLVGGGLVIPVLPANSEVVFTLVCQVNAGAAP
ncbi:DUF11 domain-containing protein [Microbulbifer sp. SH-1]|uniref:DUF11 domain-containing protein n=1 Tax=Microbulbifer sp. SH-1 TaxID=2681547 RepID=UPI001409A897|nr:DUF11 domain-containing protein [Microbulbifer sp. SH-1]QIL90098.1 DUF11 domain-containing protein [Microbulbifer sp. SH-1]